MPLLLFVSGRYPRLVMVGDAAPSDFAPDGVVWRPGITASRQSGARPLLRSNPAAL